MYCTYILISKTGKRTYTGCASDVQQRITEHNEGKVKSLKPYRPYELLQTEEFESLKDARARERFFKTATGRRRLKEIVENWKGLCLK